MQHYWNPADRKARDGKDDENPAGFGLQSEPQWILVFPPDQAESRSPIPGEDVGEVRQCDREDRQGRALSPSQA